MTNEKIIAMFFAEFRKAIKRFGLFDWKYFYGTDAEDKENYAYINLDVPARNCNVKICPQNFEENDKTEDFIRSVGRHEALHVLFGELAELAGKKYNEEEVEKEEHRIIRRLEEIF
jgi:hypothetical protein